MSETIENKTTPVEVIEASRELSAPVETSRALFAPFREPFAAAAELLLRESSATEAADARRLRLDMVKARTSISNAKRAAKSDLLIATRLIDWYHNRGADQLVEAETRLDAIEKAEARKIAAELEEKRRGRMALLADVGVDGSFYNLGAMPDDQFISLLENSMAAHAAKIEAARAAAEAERIEAERIEAERIEREKAEAAERERIRVENEKLKAEAQKREAERQAAEKVANAERERLEAIARQEREHREKLEREAEAERKAKREAERIANEARSRAARAPDLEKLESLAATVRAIEVPAMTTEAGKLVADEIADKFAGFADWIIRRAQILKN
jgi:chemosensory pili system protein ChpA (sensor histidine kinase/response regulator)